ncbi:anti-sigma-K factor rskA [Asanoa ferruginea]|uniref:Anti-sigma-K factor rskA n=1 Tax=Asanoa ferruginea TaxID=53367 RepID=A0A3E0A4V3_9ACTN|nr:anti-sigma factor [Asanoa ferruginea]REG01411.1 anti-sigma-K factor rskA [Asanoa ferruginea]GIF47964.1 hypothetical protein Afe04nite_25030 [Asanoa ferruginea]
MQHLDPDRLVLLALAEENEGPGEFGHLAECAVCRHELDALRTVAELGRESQDMGDLPPPPERIWQRVEADIAGSATAPSPVRELVKRSGRARPRWLTPVLAAAAAAVLAVAGTVAVDRFVLRAPAERVTARATLSPLPTVPGSAAGTVRVLSDGEMRIDVRNLPLTTGFHEVWLIDPDDPTRMTAIGNLSDKSSALLTLPPGIDMNRYRLVDISDEPHDGDAGHSGHSLLRGTLTY